MTPPGFCTAARPPSRVAARRIRVELMHSRMARPEPGKRAKASSVTVIISGGERKSKPSALGPLEVGLPTAGAWWGQTARSVPTDPAAFSPLPSTADEDDVKLSGSVDAGDQAQFDVG